MRGVRFGEVAHRLWRTDPRRLLGIGFVLMLAFPLWQMSHPVLREKPLVGVEEKPEPMNISWETWWNGSLAESIELKLSRSIGFRPSLIRIANQLRVIFGNNLSDMQNERVIVCKDSWLLESRYITDYASPSQDLNDAEVQEFVADLKQLQDHLRIEGKAMVFLISPSKAETYPEYLPAWVLKSRQVYQGESDIERLRRHLRGSEVVVFDVPQYFKRHANESPQKFFTKTGSHWNYYTAFQVWRELLGLINQNYETNWPLPEQIGVEYGRPRGTDDDIARLLNVFFLPGVEDPIPYPIVRTNALPASARPDFLFAGSSFSRTLMDTLYLSESGRKCDYLFYTSQHSFYGMPNRRISAGSHAEGETEMIDGFQSLNWETTLLDKEVVVLEMLEIRANELLFGFPKQALEAFKYHAKPDQVASRPDN